jgi:hypothetical protein
MPIIGSITANIHPGIYKTARRITSIALKTSFLDLDITNNIIPITKMIKLKINPPINKTLLLIIALSF